MRQYFWLMLISWWGLGLLPAQATPRQPLAPTLRLGFELEALQRGATRGFTAGLWLRREGRWGWQAGLRLARKPVDQQLVLSERTVFIRDDGNGNPMVQEVGNVTRFTQLDYLELPLYARFQLSPRLGLYAGGQVGWLTGSRGRQYWVENNVLLDSAAVKGVGGEDLFPLHLAAEAGFTWQVSALLMLRAGYTYGLLPLEVNASERVYHRFLSVGISVQPWRFRRY